MAQLTVIVGRQIASTADLLPPIWFGLELQVGEKLRN
jgi:hypothetical protein